MLGKQVGRYMRVNNVAYERPRRREPTPEEDAAGGKTQGCDRGAGP